jgi:hypothetical protein
MVNKRLLSISEGISLVFFRALPKRCEHEAHGHGGETVGQGETPAEHNLHGVQEHLVMEQPQIASYNWRDRY